MVTIKSVQFFRWYKTGTLYHVSVFSSFDEQRDFLVEYLDIRVGEDLDSVKGYHVVEPSEDVEVITTALPRDRVRLEVKKVGSCEGHLMRGWGPDPYVEYPPPTRPEPADIVLPPPPPMGWVPPPQLPTRAV